MAIVSETTTLQWLSAELSAYQSRDLMRRRRVVTPLDNGWCEVSGRRLRDFSSNDYLNLSRDPRVVAAAHEALERCGTGARASALVTGRTEYHERLERRLAEFEGCPQSVLFPSGYAANVGTICALTGPEDVVFCDRFNHASLVDGCRLSGARLRVYRHRQLDKLQRALKGSAGFRRRWIITDGIFSMDADAAPLEALCDLADRYDAAVVVDEAHATGVFGTTGRGMAEEQGVEHRVAVRIGTLSKALGSLGGFVAGSAELVDWLWNRARPQMFSTALPPACCAAALASIDIIANEALQRRKLLELSRQFREMLDAIGLPAMPHSIGPIVPLIIGNSRETMRVAEQLEQQGVLVAPIRPPTVSQGTARLRITLNAAHGVDGLRQMVDALSAVKTA